VSNTIHKVSGSVNKNNDMEHESRAYSDITFLCFSIITNCERPMAVTYNGNFKLEVVLYLHMQQSSDGIINSI
jgi:hypothetical protein